MIGRLYAWIRERLHVPPSLIVLLVVLVLLYDFGGALASLWEMAMTLLATLLGGGDHDVVGSVLWRTLPLAISAAGVTFAVLNRWLDPQSLNSYVGMAMIVLAGAIVGNAAYEKFGSRTVVLQPAETGEVVSTPIGLPESNGKSIGPPLRGIGPLAPAAEQTVVGIAVPAEQTVWERLLSIGWFTKPDLSREPQPVEPLPVIPKGPGIYGGVGGAINQLLGYLVDYEPRLFVASILVGGFAGWRLHRRVAVAHAVVAGDLSELSEREREKLKVAA
ncbi:hypothetical protein [Aeoliella sp.]|uniref:hypothetical protein n=1 Tax=Aeoliella sp. TaxID=2795800 RepID=UPI003CCBCC90